MGLFRYKRLLALVGVLGLLGLVLQRLMLSMHGHDAHHHDDKRQRLLKLEQLQRTALASRKEAKAAKDVTSGGNGSTIRADGNGSETVDGNGSLAKMKTVLMHSFPYYYELKSGPGVFLSCSQPCTLVLDQGLTEEVDSVVIYSHHYSGPATLPDLRSPRQLWVFFAVESPVNSRNAMFGSPRWRGVFNWTMSYRRDSDFYFGYGDVRRVTPQSTNPQPDLPALVSRKTKLAAWFVSNCNTQSKRQDFVKSLQQFMEVDVYGHCGPLQCGKEGDRRCLDMLNTDYYFYLALENSMCRDYLTEKVYRTLKETHAVPVVRGGANYTHLLPPHSFIDASAFPTVKALADHLRAVAADPQRYMAYLAWKKDWAVIEPVPFSFCQFCERLHHAERWAKVYPDVDRWWAEGACHDPPAQPTS